MSNRTCDLVGRLRRKAKDISADEIIIDRRDAVTEIENMRHAFERIHMLLSANHTFDELMRDAMYADDLARGFLA